jgi:hypothetical protein
MGSPWTGNVTKKNEVRFQAAGTRPPGSAYSWRGPIEVSTKISFLVSWPHGPQFGSAWMLESTRAAFGQTRQNRWTRSQTQQAGDR